MKIEPLRLAHFDGLEFREAEQRQFLSDRNSRQKLAALVSHGVGCAIIADGKIIAAFGWVELWPKVFEMWAFPSVHVKQYAMMYLRAARRYLQVLEETEQPRRLQTVSIADDVHDKWMRFLGFELEGTMAKYFVDGSDARMWARWP